MVRSAGSRIRVPRKAQLSRRVGAQIPTGFDPTLWGIPAEMAASVDRVSLWNIVATVEAFLDAGIEPEELMAHVHPARVGSTQGSGMGGMSMRSLYVDSLLGTTSRTTSCRRAWQSRRRPRDAVVYRRLRPDDPPGRRVRHRGGVDRGGRRQDPVAGKADLMIAGGFDDLTPEAIIGFGDMEATADTEVMRAKGISHSRSRAPTTAAGLGFVESQGGGTILLARGDRPPDGAAGAWRWSPTRELRRRRAHVDPGSGDGRARAPAAAARTRSWPARWPSSG